MNTDLTKTLLNKGIGCIAFSPLAQGMLSADQVKGVLTEDIIPNPITVYGKSKLAAEIIFKKNS